MQEIFSGRKIYNLEIDCLIFADDLEIFSKDGGDAVKLINILYEIAEKTALQTSFQKTMFMANKCSAPKHLIAKYRRVTIVSMFKYLG